MATEPASEDCLGYDAFREDQSSLRRFNESDQPAVKRADVGEAAITMSGANRRAVKPEGNDGSVASFCYVAPFSSMVQHMTLAVSAAMENHSRQDEEPQQ